MRNTAFVDDTRAPQDVPSAPERRRSPRVRLMSNVHGTFLPLNVPIIIRDASEGGFSVESVLPFEIGDRHRFMIAGPDGEAATIEGVCRHAMRFRTAAGDPACIAGFEFPGDATNSARRILDAVVNAE